MSSSLSAIGTHAEPVLPGLMDRRPAPISWRAWGERAVRLLRRVLAGMPPSSWVLADLALLIGSVAVGFTLFPPGEEPEPPHVAFWQAAAVFSFSATIASLIFGLYERETIMARSRIATRMLLTTGTAAVLAYAIVHVIMYAVVARRISAASLTTFLISGTLVRLAGCWAVHSVQRGLVVVGSRGLFESFCRAQSEGFLREYRLLGFAAPPGAESAADLSEADPSDLGSITRHDLRAKGVSDIVVGANAAGEGRVMEWVVAAMQEGCRVTNEATFYEKATGQILVDEITPDWFLFADLKVHCDEHATFKRLVDLTLASAGLLISSVLWPLIAFAIKLGDGGPILYWQDRVGQHGRVFRLYKFRTMRTDAENGKSVWASPDDPRVTGVGRWLRRSRLDELPQLWNVLIGQMSLVGPRPERPDIVGELSKQLPYYAERHLVKPGITGWAQISFRYGSSVEDARRKLQFDLYYLKHMSFELDTIIIFRTVGTFLRGGC